MNKKHADIIMLGAIGLSAGATMLVMGKNNDKCAPEAVRREGFSEPFVTTVVIIVLVFLIVDTLKKSRRCAP